MAYSEIQKEQVMKAMCEMCEMGRNYVEKFECLDNRFPCYLVRETFDKVIEILEE